MGDQMVVRPTLVYGFLAASMLAVSGLFHGSSGVDTVPKRPESAEISHSPDGKYAAWVELYRHELPPGRLNDFDEPYNRCGWLWTQVQGHKPVKTERLPRDRGVEFDLDEDLAHYDTLCPHNLQWGMDGALYYGLNGGPAASGVWRIKPGTSTPRYVSSTREHFRLVNHSGGDVQVICNQVRDGRWLWFSYDAGMIAEERHRWSSNEVFDPCPPKNSIRLENPPRMAGMARGLVRATAR